MKKTPSQFERLVRELMAQAPQGTTVTVVLNGDAGVTLWSDDEDPHGVLTEVLMDSGGHASTLVH